MPPPLSVLGSYQAKPFKLKVVVDRAGDGKTVPVLASFSLDATQASDTHTRKQKRPRQEEDGLGFPPKTSTF